MLCDGFFNAKDAAKKTKSCGSDSFPRNWGSPIPSLVVGGAKMQVPWKISINLWEKQILHHIIISDISHLEFLEIQKLRHVPNTSKVFDECGSFLNSVSSGAYIFQPGSFMAMRGSLWQSSNLLVDVFFSEQGTVSVRKTHRHTEQSNWINTLLILLSRTGDCERAKNTQTYRTKQLDQHTSHSALPKPKKNKQ